MIDIQLLHHMQQIFNSEIFHRSEIKSYFNDTRNVSNFTSNHGGYIISKPHDYHKSLSSLDYTLKCNKEIGTTPAYRMVNGDIVFTKRGVILARVEIIDKSDFRIKGTVYSKVSPLKEFTTTNIHVCIRLIMFQLNEMRKNN